VAIETAPCSVNALAQTADVPQSTLARIASGERRATPAVAEAVADALAEWGSTSTTASNRIRRALRTRRHS
jgi:plasmid maintenance system antidote protein VapI